MPKGVIRYRWWLRDWKEAEFPLWMLLQRHQDLMDAVARYRKANLQPPVAWLDELGLPLRGR